MYKISVTLHQSYHNFFFTDVGSKRKFEDGMTKWELKVCCKRTWCSSNHSI